MAARRLSTWWVVSLSVLTAVAAFWAIAPDWSTAPLFALWNLVATLSFLAAAVLLADEPRQLRNAVLLWAIGLFWMVNFLDLRPIGPLPWLSWVLGLLVFPLLTTAVLRYPEPRLGRLERAYVVVAALVVVVLRVWSAAVSRPEGHGYPAGTWWPAIAPGDPALAGTLRSWLDAISVLFVVAILVLLVRRVRRTTGLDRRLLVPVVVAGAAVSLVVAVEVAYRLAVSDSEGLGVVLAAEAAVMLAVPAAFLVSAVRRRLHRGVVSNLVLALPRHPSPEDVEEALRRELADPGLRILYWVPEFGSHVAVSGTVPDESTLADRLRRTITAEDGTELAIVLVDPSLHRHPEVLDATLSATALWLENGRLQAAVRAQLEDIKESRHRLRSAGEVERRRIERDLHDGAQQRLLALKVRLAVAGIEAGSSAERELIEDVTRELQDAVTELRDLARGLRPEILAEHGLPAAVADVADRYPLAVRVTVPDRRWDVDVEAAAYFTVCEALSNALKHADAGQVAVTVTDLGDRLRLEIDDDGRGGAAVEPGGGLAGIRDRVTALGGTVSVVDRERGTRVLAAIPYEQPAGSASPGGGGQLTGGSTSFPSGATK